MLRKDEVSPFRSNVKWINGARSVSTQLISGTVNIQWLLSEFHSKPTSAFWEMWCYKTNERTVLQTVLIKRIAGKLFFILLTIPVLTEHSLDPQLPLWLVSVRRKGESEWKRQLCPCSWKDVFVQTAGWKQKDTETQRGCRQSAGPDSRLGGC